MSDSRGPDFLPYALPTRPARAPVSPAPPVPSALGGLTPWGVASITAGAVALLSLVAVSLVAGHRGAGALLATLSAGVAVGAGLRALKDPRPDPSKTLVKGGMGAGVGSAVVALLLVLTHHSAVAEQPPVQVPSPAPSVPTSPQPQPSPSPASPSPTPSVGVLPPGSNDLFGLPTDPGGSPVSQDPTVKGTLTGRVVSTSGTPIEGAVVTVTRADPKDTSNSPPCPLRQQTTTGAGGRYTLQLCQLGDGLGYTVTITSAGAQARQDLFVNSGQITVYNVILAVRRA